MNLEWYKQEAARTCLSIGERTITNYIYDQDMHALHMSNGIITEFGEVVDLYKKYIMYGKIDWDGIHWSEKLIVEYGDWGWYAINWVDDLEGITIEDDALYIEDIILQNKSLVAYQDTILGLSKSKAAKSALQTWIDVGFVLGIDHEKAMILNINKLKQRFPSKFSATLAENKNEKDELDKVRLGKD